MATKSVLSQVNHGFPHCSESPEVWESIVNALHEGLLILDRSHIVQWANASAAEILNIPAGALAGLDIHVFDGAVFDVYRNPVPYDSLPVVQSLEYGVSLTGVVLGMNRPGAADIFMRINSRPIALDSATSANHALVSFVDITEQVEADATLRNNEALYRLLTNYSSDIITKHRGNGVFLFVSPASQQMLGYAPEELLGRSALEFVHPHDFDRVKDSYLSVKEGKVSTVTFRFRNQVGEYRCLENTIKPIVIGEDSSSTEIVSISRDVTARMQMESALRNSEEKYRALFDHASDSIFIHELFGKIIEVNSVAIEGLGYSREELQNMAPAEFQRSDLQTEYPSRMSRLLHDQTLVYETVHVRKNGTTYHTELSLRLIDYDGRRVVMSIGRDITERKRYEEERERSLGLLQATIESTADGILVVCNNSEVLTYNKRYEEMWNLPGDWKDLDTWEERVAILKAQVKDPDAFIEQVLKLYSDPDAESYDILELNNGLVYERYSIPFKVGERNFGRSWSFRDITQRRRAEQELRQNRAHLKAIFDHAGVAIGLLDAKGRFVLVNERWAHLFGVSTSEICNCDPMAFSHPEDIEIGRQNLEAVLNQTSSGYRIEKRYIRNDGQVFWGDLLVTPIHDDEGRLEAVLGVISEITQTKLNEQKLQNTNRELHHRNEELDAFAHTVAHDLRNPLGIILGYSHLLRDHQEELSSTEIVSIHNGIMESADKMQDIIESLLLLSQLRSEEVSKQPVDMGAVINESLKHVERLALERNAHITLPASWPVCIGYHPWIEEVWANYLSNAIKYGGNPPDITLGSEPRNGSTIRYWVHDNGNGIPEEQQSRLFHKFIRFDTQLRDGQGLGLSIVRRIIEKLDGEVGVESEPGKGSRFYFTLPAPDAGVASE